MQNDSCRRKRLEGGGVFREDQVREVERKKKLRERTSRGSVE